MTMTAASSPHKEPNSRTRDTDSPPLCKHPTVFFARDRPPVEPQLKGVPQGWHDNLELPLRDPATLVHAGAELGRPRKPPHRSFTGTARDASMGAFRETRSKLSSFSGLVKDGKTRVTVLEKQKSKGDGSLLRSSHTTRPFQPSHNPSQSINSQASVVTKGISTDASHTLAVPSLSPSLPTDWTDDNTEFSNLFTPPLSARDPMYSPSIASTNRSGSTREMVSGAVHGHAVSLSAHDKVYSPPNISDVLPFASGNPFSAWKGPSAEDDPPTPSSTKRGISSAASVLDSKDSTHTHYDLAEGWKTILPLWAGSAGKKTWIDTKGQEASQIYRVGWERDVLNLEGRLHETMFDVAGGRHTFVEFDEPPRAILDIGTGTGSWPISQALAWPEATIIGVDLVPCQTDLSSLAKAEKVARSTSCGPATGQGMWESISNRVQWQRVDFLQDLPYDTGVFDFVHIRFVGLGVSESKWADLLEEAARVLKPGGKLEIVETSYILPPTSPISLQNAFASLLLSEIIQPIPSLSLQFNLPSIGTLTSSSGVEPIFSKTWWGKDIPGALQDSVITWAQSALEYKTSRTLKRQGSQDKDTVLDRVMKELECVANARWPFHNDIDRTQLEDRVGLTKEHEVNVWAWSYTRK